MKKYGTFILSLMIFTLYSCNNGTTSKSTGKKNDVETVIEQPNDTAFFANDTILLDSYVPNSPKLTANIALQNIVLNNNAATEKAVAEISYILTGEEGKSIAEAGNRYIDKLKADYMELRPEYINIRESNDMPHWLNQEFMVSSECSNGYKGFVNYTINFFEYTGGAHPNSYCTTLTFDPNDGHEVTISEIMKLGYEEPLIELITQSIISFLNVEDIAELDEVIFDHKELYISKNVVMRKDNLTFIYNKYDIAPYAVGEIIAEIPYEKLQDILKQEYR